MVDGLDQITRAATQAAQNLLNSSGNSSALGQFMQSGAMRAIPAGSGVATADDLSGFEKPVGAAARLRLNRLRAIIVKNSPVGTSGPKGYRIGGKTYRYLKPYIAGKTKKNWRQMGSVQLSSTGKTIILRNPAVQARVQDKGANIPERHAKPGKFLMFNGIFRKKAKGFTLRSKWHGYVKKSVEEWRKTFGAGASLPVRWAPFRGVKLEP